MNAIKGNDKELNACVSTYKKTIQQEKNTIDQKIPLVAQRQQQATQAFGIYSANPLACPSGVDMLAGIQALQIYQSGLAVITFREKMGEQVLASSDISAILS